MNNLKTYLLVGLTGAGKSTTGNCILNQSGVLSQVNDTPFPTSDSSKGCTRTFACKANEQVFVLDTVGFGDPNFKQDYILQELKNALNTVDNKVDCVVFVVRKSRITKETVEFFDLVQEKVLRNKCKLNSILLITDCRDSEWARRQVDDQFFKKIVENCGGIENTYCFYLKFENEENDEQKRQEAINRLVAFLNGKTFDKVDLSHIQTSEFNFEWIKVIVPAFIKILATYFGATGAISDTLANEAGKMAFDALNSCNQQ
jgi:hypothetical protein